MYWSSSLQERSEIVPAGKACVGPKTAIGKGASFLKEMFSSHDSIVEEAKPYPSGVLVKYPLSEMQFGRIRDSDNFGWLRTNSRRKSKRYNSKF